MGCNAAKNVTIAPIDVNEISTNGEASKDRYCEDSELVSLKNVDPQSGQLENAVVHNVQKAGNGMSFEIMFDGDVDKEESIIQKHPPKRILELQESENKEPVTLEKLQEKLEEAELRRQEILQQRIQSATLNRMKNSSLLQKRQSQTEDDATQIR